MRTILVISIIMMAVIIAGSSVPPVSAMVFGGTNWMLPLKHAACQHAPSPSPDILVRALNPNTPSPIIFENKNELSNSLECTDIFGEYDDNPFTR